eukprot:gb/GECG01001699.1/.p1 GENE.gb/GECG01001699.1/~~gb/GECG01001699.1/.p1  ORF type:complete len:834 (+),score=114.25 gb/GECG01001699.1/:1-2502(+)
MDYEIEAEEAAQRRQLLDCLCQAAGVKDPNQGNQRLVVRPEQFQSALHQVGMQFGTAPVDRVMLQCKIHDDGNVDFHRFAEDVFMREEQERLEQQKEDENYYGNLRNNVSGRGLEFQQALENTVMGGAKNIRIPPELQNLPQPEKVRRLAKEIHSLFKEFDSGSMSVDVFREHLRALGLEETPEVQKVIKQTPISFSQLFRALMSTDKTGVPEGAAAGEPSNRTTKDPTTQLFSDSNTPISGKSRRGSVRMNSPGRDIISWRTSHEGSPHSEYQWQGRFRGGTTGGYNDKHIHDTGAGNIIYQRGDVPAGVVQSSEGLSKKLSTRAFDRHMPRESGVGKALWGDYRNDDPDARFESVSQSYARIGTGGKGLLSRPLTSAGYHTSDGGLVREQIYGIVRQLDQGVIDVNEFRHRMNELNIPIPLTVEKLLTDYEANGSADFARFVKAFEDYFAIATHRDRDRRPVTSSPAQREQYEEEEEHPKSSDKKSNRYVNEALRGHGDILSWRNVSQEEVEEEVQESMRRAGLRPKFRSRNRDLQQPSNSELDIISWQGGKHFGEWRPPKKGPGADVSARRNAGDIISWAGGEAGAEMDLQHTDRMSHLSGVSGDARYTGGQARGGDLLPNGVPVGRGRARVHTSLAEKDKYEVGQRPYGVDRPEDISTGPSRPGASGSGRGPEVPYSPMSAGGSHPANSMAYGHRPPPSPADQQHQAYGGYGTYGQQPPAQQYQPPPQQLQHPPPQPHQQQLPLQEYQQQPPYQQQQPPSTYQQQAAAPPTPEYMQQGAPGTYSSYGQPQPHPPMANNSHGGGAQYHQPPDGGNGVSGSGLSMQMPSYM